MTGNKYASGHCRVVAGQKYLKAPLDSSAICQEIERTIKARAPQADFKADVKVMSASRLTAALVVNGRALPEHKFAVMDNDLSLESLERFARALAADVAAAAKR